MKLIDVQGEYNAIFSLGGRCLASYRLVQYRLRLYTGVIDWMLSPKLLKVIDLLENRFGDFMKKENLLWDGYDVSGKCLLLTDKVYDITSVHDFPITRNTPENWVMYEEFRVTLDRRIQRFLNKLETCQKILFVRIGGTYEEAKRLETVLSKMIQGEFRVLLINDIDGDTVVEYDWDLLYTCSIGMPLLLDDRLWGQVLQKIFHSAI